MKKYNMMESTLTYEAASKELALIAKEMEEETISVDELAAKVKRASELIEFCQAKLKSTETEVSKIISGMENPKQ
ncbi:exodeoxyribonuclease VII small subunit [Flavobacterium hungaricum]|uniref:Exodeoxyribonuclease VII small subunit n=1 Tax=Flavobacterium hungaricum TaxID=2082725 RepID=A0ABR9TMT3_9FLAO|nr:exodeoxyribonuclease VII small subunit [Flavobacterium hungaricum]MBE8726327.1 exodeoxyribonuclease VII small subunit [Flavobacterium hungaricum]